MTNMNPGKRAVMPTAAAKQASDEAVDVGEMLIAELRARRERLRDLLALVRQELERVPARRSSARTHSRRQPPAMRRIA